MCRGVLSASCLFTATQVLVWEELELVVAGAGEDKDINLSQTGVEVAKIGFGIDSSKDMSSSNIRVKLLTRGLVYPCVQSVRREHRKRILQEMAKRVRRHQRTEAGRQRGTE